MCDINQNIKTVKLYKCAKAVIAENSFPLSLVKLTHPLYIEIL